MGRMDIVFDRAVDPGLIERSLAPAVFGSMWLDPAVVGPRPDYPSLPGAITCDLLVVGGGYTGLGQHCMPPNAIPAQRSC